MLAPLAVLGSVALLAAAEPSPQPYEVGSLNATINYTPSSSWGVYIAPGGFQTEANDSVAMFSTKQTNLSAVNWTTPCMYLFILFLFFPLMLTVCDCRSYVSPFCTLCVSLFSESLDISYLPVSLSSGGKRHIPLDVY
jgi:hypothetical protein